jgi:hypothetical protein
MLLGDKLMLWYMFLAAADADTCMTPSALSAHLADSECPTLALLSLQTRARNNSTLPCLDESLGALGLGRISTAEQPPPPPPPGSTKALRDAFNMPLRQESENFVLRWGSQKSMSTSDASKILDSFEITWESVMVEMAYIPPQGSDTYKFNIYIGDSGNNGPGSYGAAYYSGDPEGYPMIVVSQGTYDDDGFGRVVGAHEFYHALQGASGANYQYTDDSPGAWYWEATANWITTEIYPQDQSYYIASFLYGFHMYPQLPVNYFNYPDGDAGLREYYQYGAFIFPYYLSREVGDADLIRSSWLKSDLDDPLKALDDVLAARWGTTIEEAFFDFSAWNATYNNYDDAETFQAFMDPFEEHGADGGHIIDEVNIQSSGWQDAPAKTAPHTYGTNYLYIDPGNKGMLIEFEGVESGDRGGIPTWDVRAILEGPGGDVERAMSLSGSIGELELPDVQGANSVWLVVSVISDSPDRMEQFDWAYNISESGSGSSGSTTDPGNAGNGNGGSSSMSPTFAGDEKQGWSGCSAVSGSAVAWLAVLAFAGALGRRRD